MALKSCLQTEAMWVTMIPFLGTEAIGRCMSVCKHLRTLISNLCFVVKLDMHYYPYRESDFSLKRKESEYRLKRGNLTTFNLHKPIVLYDPDKSPLSGDCVRCNFRLRSKFSRGDSEYLTAKRTWLQRYAENRSAKYRSKRKRGDYEYIDRSFACRIGWRYISNGTAWSAPSPCAIYRSWKLLTDDLDHRYCWYFSISQQPECLDAISITRVEVSERRPYPVVN